MQLCVLCLLQNVHHNIVFSGSHTQKIGEEEGTGKRAEKIVVTVLKGQGKRGVLSLEERAEAIIFLAKSRKRKLLEIFKFVRNLMTGSDEKK